ncbi:MAG: DUF6020 family protein [Coriobacteriales bacterium]|jgi:hypothetical protein|nr:DUF6020 family protein [Coriobacteriales bacterium]
MKKFIKTLFASWQQPVAALVLAVLFAAAIVFISPIYYHASLDSITGEEAGVLLAFGQCLLLALPIAIGLLVVLVYGGVFFRWLGRFNPLKVLSLSWRKRSVFVAAGIILFFWLPWIIIYYPGCTPYDPVAQIYQIHGSGAFRPELWEPTVDGWISNSHPILHTLILGGFFELGDLLGSQNLGIFLYSLFQCLVRSLAFGAVCCYLRRIGVPKLFCLLSLAFFALYPAIATSSMVTFKDHLFSPFYALYVIQIIEIVRTRGAVLKGWKFVLGLVAVSLVLSLLKHPGLYIVVACSLVLLLLYRRFFRQLLLTLAVPALVVMLILPTLVFPALHVISDGDQDPYGPLLAQTARVINEHPDAMSTEEREIIDRIVPYRIMATGYSTASTDYIKGNFRQDSSLADRLDYLALWARQAFVYPQEYLEGFFTIQDSWFVPAHGWDVYDNLYPGTAQHVVDVVGHNNRLPVNKAEEVRAQLYFDGPVELYSAKLFMRSTFLNLHYLPVVGFLFTNACYTFYLPCLFAAIILLYCRRFVPVLLPVLLTLIVLFISPMDMSRYALPLLESTPLIAGVAILAWMYPQKKEKKKIGSAEIGEQDQEAGYAKIPSDTNGAIGERERAGSNGETGEGEQAGSSDGRAPTYSEDGHE